MNPTASASTFFKSNGSGGTNQSQFSLGVGNGTERLNIFNNDNSPIFTIASTSNVGIGTTSPGFKLEVKGGDVSSNDAFTGTHTIFSRNTEAGTGNLASFAVGNDVDDRLGSFNAYSSTYTTSANNIANGVRIQANGAGGLSLGVLSGSISLYGGNVGIGTTGPGAKLDIRQSASNVPGIRIANTDFTLGSVGTSVWMYTGATSGNTDVRLQVLQSGETAFGPLSLNPSGGNVGIGTTGPVATLQISKAAAPTTVTKADMYLGLGAGESTTSGYRLIGFGYSLSETYYPAYMGYIETSGAGSGTGALVFGTRTATTDTASTERMRIDSAGNVGIGTTGPLGLLQVSDTTSAGPASSGNATGKLIVGKTVDTVLAIGSVASDYAWLQSQAADSAGAFYDIALNPLGGNVGIGTTGPAGLLEVAKSAANTSSSFGTYSTTDTDQPYLFLRKSASATLGSSIATADGEGIGTIEWDAPNSGDAWRGIAVITVTQDGPNNATRPPASMTFSVSNGSSVANVMTIASSSYVGIGDPTPDYGLDVVADINSDDCFREAGTQVAGTCASDLSLKQNIMTLENSLDKILQLRPVTFEWREGIDQYDGIRYIPGTQIGLVAQEVEGVFPEWVSEKHGFKAISYNLELQMRLIKSIQELDARYASLSLTAEELMAKVASQNYESGITNQGNTYNISTIASGLMVWFKDTLHIVFEDGLLKVAQIFTDKLVAKEICVEDICVDKTKLKALLEKNGIEAQPTPAPIYVPQEGYTGPAPEGSIPLTENSSDETASASEEIISETEGDGTLLQQEGNVGTGTPTPTPTPTPEISVELVPENTPEASPEPETSATPEPSPETTPEPSELSVPEEPIN